jgi:hypothetical protein
MISCKRASELISKEADEPLTKIERLQLKLHLYVCEFCEHFRRNLQLLRAALKGFAQGDAAQHEEMCAGPDLKDRLRDAVNKELEKK